jgi:hypothetical protein
MDFLRDLLKEMDADLFQSLERSWKIAEEDWLPAIAANSGSFNSYPHFRNLEKHLEHIMLEVKDEKKDEKKYFGFNSLELYSILASILFHDIGRVDQGKSHAAITHKTLLEKYGDLGIPNYEIAKSLGRICEFHDPENENKGKDLEDELKTRYIEPYGRIRELEVASLLTLLDHMDSSFMRVVPIYLKPEANLGAIGAFRRKIPGVYWDKKAQMICTYLDDMKEKGEEADLNYTISDKFNYKAIQAFKDHDFAHLWEKIDESQYNSLNENERKQYKAIENPLTQQSVKIVYERFLYLFDKHENEKSTYSNIKFYQISKEEYDSIKIKEKYLPKESLSLKEKEDGFFIIDQENFDRAEDYSKKDYYRYKVEFESILEEDSKSEFFKSIEKILNFEITSKDEICLLFAVTKKVKEFNLCDWLVFAGLIQADIKNSKASGIQNIFVEQVFSWPKSTLLAIIMSDIRANFRSLKQIRNFLAQMNLHARCWLVNYREHLFNILGQETYEPIFYEDYLMDVVQNMWYLSTRVFGINSFTYEVLASACRESDIGKIKLAVKRLSIILQPGIHISCETIKSSIIWAGDSSWKWNISFDQKENRCDYTGIKDVNDFIKKHIHKPEIIFKYNGWQ